MITSIALFLTLAQEATRIAIDQIRVPASTTQRILVFDTTGRGRFTSLPPEFSVTCDSQTNRCELVLAQNRPLQTQIIRVTSRLASLPLARVPLELRILRNGLELSEGVDYTLAGSVITFLPDSTPEDGDVVKIQYR